MRPSLRRQKLIRQIDLTASSSVVTMPIKHAIVIMIGFTRLSRALPAVEKTTVTGNHHHEYKKRETQELIDIQYCGETGAEPIQTSMSLQSTQKRDYLD
jgi:hypothetical protein